jgi:hypothetical protein
VLAIVDVVLPAKGESRERWLTPSEAAIAEDCARGITPFAPRTPAARTAT